MSLQTEKTMPAPKQATVRVPRFDREIGETLIRYGRMVVARDIPTR